MFILWLFVKPLAISNRDCTNLFPNKQEKNLIELWNINTSSKKSKKNWRFSFPTWISICWFSVFGIPLECGLMNGLNVFSMRLSGLPHGMWHQTQQRKYSARHWLNGNWLALEWVVRMNALFLQYVKMEWIIPNRNAAGTHNKWINLRAVLNFNVYIINSALSVSQTIT